MDNRSKQMIMGNKTTFVRRRVRVWYCLRYLLVVGCKKLKLMLMFLHT